MAECPPANTAEAAQVANTVAEPLDISEELTRCTEKGGRQTY